MHPEPAVWQLPLRPSVLSNAKKLHRWRTMARNGRGLLHLTKVLFVLLLLEKRDGAWFSKALLEDSFNPAPKMKILAAWSHYSTSGGDMPVFPFPSHWASSAQLQADNLWKVPCILVARNKRGSRISRVRDHSPPSGTQDPLPELYGDSGHRPQPSQKETKDTFNSRLKVRTLHPATHSWGPATENRKPHPFRFFFFFFLINQ